MDIRMVLPFIAAAIGVMAGGFFSDKLLKWTGSANNPLTPFPNNLIIERVSTDQRYKIANRRFIIEDHNGAIAAEREIESVADLARLFEEIFNIVPPVPVAEIFARIAPV